MASKSQVLYVGVTSDLVKRVYEHQHDLKEGFTKKYKVHRFVYYEVFEDIRYAIEREKELKGWSRAKKIALIEKDNFEWKDLVSGIV